MKTDKNDKMLDELIGRAITRERPKLDFDKWKDGHEKEIDNFNLQSRQSSEPVGQFDLWRTIMKSKMTKISVAVGIIIAVLLSITLLDKSVTTAYAIEQTIEAFKNVRFLHLVRLDDTGQIEDERWIELGMDGRQVRYRQKNSDWLDIEDGKTTAVYHKDKSTVVLYNGKDKQYQWIGELGLFLENLRKEGKVIEENAEYNGLRAHIVLWPMMNSECYIDPQTKLPIAIGNTQLSYEQPQSLVRFHVNLRQDRNRSSAQ